MASANRVAVIGGTGHFGARIARRLARVDGIELVITSRSPDRAQALVNTLRNEGAKAQVTAAALEQDADDLRERIAALGADVAIHTAGPYQGSDYSVAMACAESGTHYVDLADGRQFVAEFHELESAAHSNNVTLVTGASTLPGVSSAVVSGFRNQFSHIDEIATTIAPAHQTPRGVGTVRAVLSYCGSPFDTWRNGAWHRVYGWQDMRWQKCPEVGRRLSAACDVPDLVLLPDFVPGLKTTSFHAALEAPWEQLGLWMMAWLRRLGLVSDWAKHSSTFSAVSERLIRFGSDRGGMHMRIAGTDRAGQSRVLSWHLIAGSNHGPEIPCTPAIIVAKKLLSGGLTRRGAFPCLGLFSVSEFMQELSSFDISAGTSG